MTTDRSVGAIAHGVYTIRAPEKAMRPMLN